MPWITVADNHIGSRQEQQDRFLVAHGNDGNTHLLIVADGAGGHKAGAVAAQTAIDWFNENRALLWFGDDPESILKALILECNERVQAVGDEELACSTLVLVLVRGDEVYWCHVGDSRFYLIRDREVVIQTTDHSVIELQRAQVAQGTRSVADASANGLYMCLGAPTELDAPMGSSLVREGDTLVLCSDGLWNQVDMSSFIDEVSEQPLSQELMNRWTKKAKDARSERSDNITVIAARLVAKPSFWSSASQALVRLFKK